MFSKTDKIRFVATNTKELSHSFCVLTAVQAIFVKKRVVGPIIVDCCYRKNPLNFWERKGCKAMSTSMYRRFVKK